VQALAKKMQIDLLLSLVNVGSMVPRVKQAVYYHQALLFGNKDKLKFLFSFSFRKRVR
jgi:hypothetical protein